MGGLPPEEVEAARERIKRVFRFLRAFAERNLTVQHVLTDQPWVLRLADLPRHPDVNVGVVELVAPNPDAAHETDHAAERIVQNAPLIRVRRPKTSTPPEPPAELRGWVLTGWEDCDGTIAIADTRNRPGGDGATVTERFVDNAPRVELLRSWRAQWDAWAQTERPARQTEKLFCEENFGELPRRLPQRRRRLRACPWHRWRLLWQPRRAP